MVKFSAVGTPFDLIVYHQKINSSDIISDSFANELPSKAKRQNRGHGTRESF